MSKETYQIFLSSTSVDLKSCRDKVREFIERLSLTAIRMETFGARPNVPFKTCELQVKGCDALIVIVGRRYGWVPTNNEGGDGVKSITWWEVTWALEAGKPVYAFLCDMKADLQLESEQDRLIGAKTEKEFLEIGNAVGNLVKFREFLDSKTTREIFSSVDDLAAKVTSSLQGWYLQIVEERAKGWYKKEQSMVAPALGSSGKNTHQEELHNYEQLYWQEQIHLTSARCLLPNIKDESGIGIAIIAGKADLNHPALAANTAVIQFDVRANKSSQNPDGYTTGIVALLVGNSKDGINYRGIVPDARVSVFQVLSEDYYTTDSTLLAAIEAAVVGGNKIVCLTLGGGAGKSPIYDAVFKRLHKLGVIIVCAAGNESTSEPRYPGAYEQCIAVGASNRFHSMARFSNFGDWVTTSAPGENIPVAELNNDYEKRSGTTYACTIATGVIALMLKVNKDLTLEQIREILKTTGTPIYGSNSIKTSYMQIDAFQAIQSASKVVKENEASSNRKRSTSKTGKANQK